MRGHPELPAAMAGLCVEAAMRTDVAIVVDGPPQVVGASRTAWFVRLLQFEPGAGEVPVPRPGRILLPTMATTVGAPTHAWPHSRRTEGERRPARPYLRCSRAGRALARSDPQLARDAVGVERTPGSGAHHHEQVQGELFSLCRGRRVSVENGEPPWPMARCAAAEGHSACTSISGALAAAGRANLLC
jgi:hypothetical protein